MIRSSIELKNQFKFLLQDKTLENITDENMVFGDLQNSNEAIWSLLLMNGHLKSIATTILRYHRKLAR